jgi:hypothetical protein
VSSSLFVPEPLTLSEFRGAILIYARLSRIGIPSRVTNGVPGILADWIAPPAIAPTPVAREPCDRQECPEPTSPITEDLP